MPSKKLSINLEQRVYHYIRENQLIESSQKVLVAVSGGPDSVCLLHLLYRLRDELKIDLHVAHLNHQLRNEESEADARYVCELAKKLAIPVTIGKGEVTTYQHEHRLSLEEAAREVRYMFLSQTADSVEANITAVGHTLNDQVETILLHIIRGTGTRGLRGLQSSQSLTFSNKGLTVIRPLLEIKREETEEYCAQYNLQPRSDSSNLSLSMLRNRVRRELLPLLKNYNPGVFDSILRIKEISQDDLSLIESESLKAWRKVVKKNRNTYTFDKSGFRVLPASLQRQLLRMAIDKLIGTLKDIETRHIEEILRAMKIPAGRSINLPEGLVFSIEYDRYLLGRNNLELIPFPIIDREYEIKVPGKTEIPGWIITTNIESQAKLTSLAGSDDDGVLTAKMDMSKAGRRLALRPRRRGDYFQPLGMSESKKVGEFMLDAHIPRSWRDRIPIINSDQQIIWVAGYRIDERVKVTPETNHILMIRMTPTIRSL
jgi:tRNA(Ile)-lysidine synthase